ncbi:MAG: transglycosylase SLT domain-containing protein [Paracoccaceae bacterium]
MPVRARITGRTAQLALTVVWTLLFTGIAGGAGQPGAGPDGICEASSDRAARRVGVPENVLRAISLTETGRRRRGRTEAWPWTVNMQGEGRWFETRAAALAYTKRGFDAGARSFDVGCFQINYRWHGGAFPSIDAMFDPDTNAVYAARFLSGLFAETGSWSAAAGAYHSRTAELAARYRSRFDRILARLDGGARTSETAATPAAEIRRPESVLTGALLAADAAEAGRAAAPGSLVILAAQADDWRILTPARGALY